MAAVAAASLGFGSAAPSTDSAKLLMCLVPLICIYVDMNSLHIMIRVITIGTYLKLSGNRYERFVFQIRDKGAANPFVFEETASYVSSLFINVIIFLFGIFILVFGLVAPRWYGMVYAVLAFLGFLVTLRLRCIYKSRSQEVMSQKLS